MNKYVICCLLLTGCTHTTVMTMPSGKKGFHTQCYTDQKYDTCLTGTAYNVCEENQRLLFQNWKDGVSQAWYECEDYHERVVESAPTYSEEQQ